MVTLTTEEFDALSPAAQKLHLKNEEKLVYGGDVKHGKDGKPIQQGIGSKGHETGNHFAAILKREKEGEEPPGAYANAVAEIWGRDPKRAESLGLRRPPPKEKKAKPEAEPKGA